MSHYIEEFSSMKCHLTLFYKDEEPLHSDWYVSIQPVVISPASCLIWKVARALLFLPPKSLFARPHMQMKFSTPEELSHFSWGQEHLLESGFKNKSARIFDFLSFMYNGNEMRGPLRVCSLANQMLELLGRIRIGRFTSSGKGMAHAHRLLRKRDYSIFIIN